MNILVDARVLCKYTAGIGTFFQGALLQWAEYRSGDTFYLVVPKGIEKKASLPNKPDNIRYIQLSNSVFPAMIPNIILLQLSAPLLCKKYDITLYFSPFPYIPIGLPSIVKTLIVVHDVVNIEYRDTMHWSNKLANFLFFRFSVNRSDYLWCNSLYTRSKVLEYFPKRKCKNPFVGCGGKREVFNLIEPTVKCKNDKIASKFVLFVGSLEPRKNLPFLLKIAPILYGKYGLQLVVVGCNKWKSSQVSEIIDHKDFLKTSVCLCEYISDYELADLYHRASCFVSASLNEGFGLPQLEAMLCGCRVVAAHNSAMIETTENNEGAMTVKGYDKDEWIETIVKMANSNLQVNQSSLLKYDWGIIVPKMLQRFKL